MKCIICDSGMSYYFSKNFNSSFELNNVDYYRCINCGFVSSKTHYNFSKDKWYNLNKRYHDYSNLRQDNPYNRNQRYFNQSLMISLMHRFNFFQGDNFLDWGSGIGSVSKLSQKLFDIKIKNYDKYIAPEIYQVSAKELKPRSFDLVINCAVFEHVTKRDTLDEIESYVSKEGCFAIHTLVPETVPKDSEWMYLMPVHCSFHTNYSMQLLMNQWGYKCSVYNEHSKMWILFKKSPAFIQPLVNNINQFLGWKYLKFKKGFMDYWK